MLAFVFPGQGSQSVGMLTDIAQQFSEVEETFSESSRILGYDLWKLVAKGPPEALDQTIHTQPALLTASIAIWRILKARINLQPLLLAGHSLGEYSALVSAEAISFPDAVRLVTARGQYMQEASSVGEGALAVLIGLEDGVVQAICKQSTLKNEILTPANFNCPQQIVIAGHTKAIQRALILAKKAGAKLAKLLPISVPSHCLLMKSASEKLAKLLQKVPIQMPSISVVNNVDAVIYKNPEMIRDGLVRQLFMPVRWVEVIQTLAKANIVRIIECGPGKVLNGLNKRIIPAIELTNTHDLASLKALLSVKQGA